MPKRDADYMREQREAICAATLQCLLDKGLSGTTLRDICKQADLSVGAFYTHFATKEDAVLAACLIEHDNGIASSPLASWRDYVQFIRHQRDWTLTDQGRRRSRLSMQFISEIALESNRPQALMAIYAMRRQAIKESLERMHAKGEITLPLGLEQTADAHYTMLIGALYTQLGFFGADSDEAEAYWSSVITALGHMAGLKAGQDKNIAASSRKQQSKSAAMRKIKSAR